MSFSDFLPNGNKQHIAKCVTAILNGDGTLEGRMASSHPDAKSRDEAYQLIAERLKREHPEIQDWTLNTVTTLLFTRG